MKIKLTDRDRSLLKSLWTWKVLGTSAITQKFFPERSPITAYKRLWMLKESGFVQIITDEAHEINVWGLTSKGFAVIREFLQAELEEDGFASETVNHDFLVSAFHIGDWLHELPSGAEIFSEQQLRRYHPVHYPAWIPRSFLHRPDGYTLTTLKNNNIVIAIEVELTRKKDPKYEILAEKYEAQPGIFRVVWLVPNRAFACYVQERLKNAVKDKAGIHDFITLDDYRRRGWQTPFLLGYESGRTLDFLLNNRIETSPKPVSALFLLDGRLCPHKTKTSADSEKSKKCYRLALSASPSINPNVSPLPTLSSSNPYLTPHPYNQNQQTNSDTITHTIPIVSKESLVPMFNKEVVRYEK